MANQLKSRCLSAIAEILKQYNVTDQASLSNLLKERNVCVSQSTLSIYLSEMGAKKVRLPHLPKPVYRLPDATEPTAVTEQYAGLISPTVGFRTYSVTGQLLVIRTAPGYAHPIATIIEQSRSPICAGVIAGYNTIFVAIAETAARAEVIDWLHSLIPESVVRSS